MFGRERAQHIRQNSFGHCRRVLSLWLPSNGLALLGLSVLLTSSLSQGAEIEDFAQIYVNEYFEPPPSMQLSEEAENKAEALAHYMVGRMQENKERNEEAIASYLRVLQLQPDQLDLARKCAYLLASRAGKQAKAKQLLEATLEMNREIAFPYVMLSEFLSTYHSNNQDNKDRALSLAKEAVEKFPADAMTYEHLAKMYLLGKRTAEAKELLSGALKKSVSDPDYWIRLGKVAIRVWPMRMGVEGNEKELAILNEFYSKAMTHAGRNDEARERSGDYYATTQQFDEAEKIYNDLVQRKTDRLDLRKKLARVYKLKGDMNGYTETLLGIVEINPGDVSTHREIAAAYRGLKDVAKSVKHERIALKIGKGSAKDYLRVALEMNEGKLFEEASIFLKEAAYLFPKSPEFPYYLAIALTQLNRYKEAVESFKSCEKIAKKARPTLLNERFYFSFAAASERDGQIEEAATLFNKSIELIRKVNPENQNKRFTAQVYNYLGYMWLENDMKIDAAGELIKSAILLDPNSAAISDSLGWFYFKKGQYKEAKEELLRSEVLLEETGEDPDAVILDHIAQTFYALGEREKAIDYMERAVKYDPEKEEYTERLAIYQKGMAPKDEVQPPSNL